MLKVTNLVKKYGENIAVHHINFEINKGEVVGILGPNGAGKTTTMKLLTGYLVPDAGEIKIDNRQINFENTEFRKLIGYMPETNPLFKDKLVIEALEFALDIHEKFDKEYRKSRLDFVIKSTSLENVVYKPIGELSKGFKQRVGLAVALIHDPKILILDEPTEGLDPNQRVEIRNLIKTLGEDRTVLISTHVMAEVEAMCNRVIIVSNGKVIADEATANILSAKPEQLVEVDFQFELKSFAETNFKKEFNDFEVELIANSNGFVHVKVKSQSGIKLMEKITKYIRENQTLVLHSLSKKQQTLEEIFRNLTA
jgi:ABC-2 type transport system ATP-binding protein